MDEVESTLNNAQENAYAGTEEELLEGWKAALLAADYKGIMTGILHTRNDNVADTVTNEAHGCFIWTGFLLRGIVRASL